MFQACSAARCCVGWSFHQVHQERTSSTPTETPGSLSPLEMASVVVRQRLPPPFRSMIALAVAVRSQFN